MPHDAAPMLLVVQFAQVLRERGIRAPLAYHKCCSACAGVGGGRLRRQSCALVASLEPSCSECGGSNICNRNGRRAGGARSHILATAPVCHSGPPANSQPSQPLSGRHAFERVEARSRQGRPGVPGDALCGLFARAAAAPSSVPTGRALARAGLLFFALRGALPGF